MKRTLTIEQCRALLSLTQPFSSNGKGKAIDHALIVSLLLCGGAARSWTWEDASKSFLSMPTSVYEALKALAISKKLSLFPFNHENFRAVHWVGGGVSKKHIFSVGSSALTTQEVTRRLNRYGRMAGIVGLNLRKLVNTHHLLVELYGEAQLLDDALAITVAAATTSPLARKAKVTKQKPEGRLHGIGRRGFPSMSSG